MATNLTRARLALDSKHPKHKVGDTVTWQTRAYDPSHTGTVIAILEPGDDATKHVIAAEKAAGERYSSGRDRTSGVRSPRRYLVKVPRESTDGIPLAPHWYSPVVAVVDKAAR
jgi:hypothetical protein